MSEASFTSGPWDVSEPVHFEYNDPEYFVGPSSAGNRKFSEEQVCVVWSPAGDSKANAHLIAAAPDMYSELAEIKEQLQFENYRGDMRDRIDAVLTKARGEQA